MIILPVLLCMGCLIQQGEAYTVAFGFAPEFNESHLNIGETLLLRCTISGTDVGDITSNSIPVIISRTYDTLTPMIGSASLNSSQSIPSSSYNVSTGENVDALFSSTYSVEMFAGTDYINYTLTITGLQLGDSGNWACNVGSEMQHFIMQVTQRATLVEILWSDPSLTVSDTTNASLAEPIAEVPAPPAAVAEDAAAESAAGAAEDTAAEDTAAAAAEVGAADVATSPTNASGQLPSSNARTVESGIETYLGCRVVGGHPRPLVEMQIGNQINFDARLTASHTLSGPDGYTYTIFEQIRADPILVYDWRYDEEIVKCLGEIPGRVDLVNSAEIALDVQGKPAIISTHCRDIMIDPIHPPDAIVCSVYCNPLCTYMHIEDETTKLVSIEFTPSIMTNPKGTVKVPETFDYMDEMGTVNPSKIWCLEVPLPKEPKYLKNYKITVENTKGKTIHTIRVTLPATTPPVTNGHEQQGTTKHGSEKDEAGGGNMIMIIGVIVSLLVVGGIIAAILLSKKKPKESPALRPPSAKPPVKPDDVKVDISAEEEEEEEGEEDEEDAEEQTEAAAEGGEGAEADQPAEPAADAE